MTEGRYMTFTLTIIRLWPRLWIYIGNFNACKTHLHIRRYTVRYTVRTTCTVTDIVQVVVALCVYYILYLYLIIKWCYLFILIPKSLVHHSFNFNNTDYPTPYIETGPQSDAHSLSPKVSCSL